MSRLTVERLEELYLGTLKLVAEHGYDKLTMDQIAEATHSSKATLYRQWGSKAGLVVEALRCLGETEEELVDTGSLRGDLAAVMAKKGPPDEDESELITAIMHAMRTNEELAETVRTQILEPWQERIRLLMQRAVDRGEIAADNPALAYADVIFIAPVILRPLLDGVVPDPDYIADYFEAVLLPALGAH